MAKRIFLMDDSAFALDLLSIALVDDGLQVMCGRDLADLERLNGAHLDLILMDVEMPEAFGDDVTSWLVAQGLSTPVHLLSNLPVDQLARRAQECGAQGYIWKGSGLDAVLNRVHEILATTTRSRSLAPTLLISEFMSVAAGRLRRAEAMIDYGAVSTVVGELHTLAGEASLLGLTDFARTVDECRAEAAAAAGNTLLEATTALRMSLAVVNEQLLQAASRARVSVVPTKGRSGRILLLDDSEIYRSVLLALLEDAGYAVVECRRIAEARHRMRDGSYDLAILDHQLDDGLGTELIPELRRHAPRTTLLLLSGQEMHVPAADLMLPKTTDPAELLRRIDELIESGSKGRRSSAERGSR